MKTVVFIETNFSGLDAFVYCKLKGYHSILITDNPGRFESWFPESCLHKIQAASEVIQVKNSNDFDELKQVLAPYLVDAILTFAEIRTHVTARLANSLGLKGTPVSTVETAQNKYKFRERLQDALVDSIFHRVVNSVDELQKVLSSDSKITFPCFVKPCVGHSSIGATVCRNYEGIGSLVAKLRGIASEGISTSFVIEEFLDGPLVSVELLTVAPGQHQVIGISDREVVESSIEVGSSFPVYPRGHESVIHLAKNALNAIGYHFGPSHIEIILTSTGRPHLVEVNTRVGGSGHSVMLDAALGRSVVGDCVELCLGNHPLDLDLYQYQQGAAWQCYASQVPGVLKTLPNEQALRTLPGVQEVWFHQDVGTELGELDSNFNWILQVVCTGSDASEAKNNAKQAICIAIEKTVIAPLETIKNGLSLKPELQPKLLQDLVEDRMSG